MRPSRLIVTVLFLYTICIATGWAQTTPLPGLYTKRVPVPLAHSIFFSTGPSSLSFSEDITILKDYSINPLRPISHLLISNPGTSLIQANLNGTVNYNLAATDIDARFVSLQQDIDGDQFDDYIVKFVGLTGNDLYAVSGRTGALIYQTFSTIPIAVNQFHLFPETALASGKDFDGDGINDVVLSQIGQPLNPHGFELFSGSSGASLCSVVFSPDTTFAHTGRMSFKMDDLEGDGMNELLVGFAGHDEVKVFQFTSAFTCTQIATITSPLPGAMGFAVNTISDQDGDGKRDIVASDMFRVTPNGGFGAVYVISSNTNALLQTLFSPEPQLVTHGSYDFASEGDRLLVEDVTGDGIDDIVVGDPQVETFPGLHGRAYTYNVATGNVVQTYNPLFPLSDDGFARTLTTVRKDQHRYLVVGVSGNGLPRLDLFLIQ